MSSAPERRGFTLVELLVAMALAGIVTGALATVLTKQQRFYWSAADLIETRGQIRQATSILPNDLRGLSSAAGDLLAMHDSAVEFHATVGASVACDVGATTLDLPPMGLARHTLTAWSSRPRPGDVAHVLDDVTGAFLSHAVVSVDSGAAWCPGPPFTHATLDRGKYRYRVTLAAALTPGIVRGSPVRFTRRVRYSLYRSPADSRWHLGYADHNPGTGALNAVQPVSGPYRPYAADTTSGLAFHYADASGSAVPSTHSTRVARIDVVVRGITRGALRIDGMRTTTAGRYADHDAVSVAIRNRW